MSADRLGLTPCPTPGTHERGAGCDEQCVVIAALLPGHFGREHLLLHDPDAHERYGRRQMGDPDLLIATGPLVLDTDGAGVQVDGQPVHPTAVELRLLFALAARLGRVVPSEHLAACVWGTGILDEPMPVFQHLVRVNMSRLRRRLFPAGGMITTAFGLGYRLQAVPPGEAAPLPSTHHPQRIDGWAIHWAACRVCGLTDLPHAGRGYCTSCIRAGTVRPHRGRTSALAGAAAARRLAAARQETDR